jgi:hypothetical protein
MDSPAGGEYRGQISRIHTGSRGGRRLFPSNETYHGHLAALNNLEGDPSRYPGALSGADGGTLDVTMSNWERGITFSESQRCCLGDNSVGIAIYQGILACLPHKASIIIVDAHLLTFALVFTRRLSPKREMAVSTHPTQNWRLLVERRTVFSRIPQTILINRIHMHSRSISHLGSFG